MTINRWRCETCREISLDANLLKAFNPFDRSEVIVGCPKCKSVNDFTAVCDEEGCVQQVSCGTPTPTGYRNTCSKHAPK
jgi:phage FluMu protein Com